MPNGPERPPAPDQRLARIVALSDVSCLRCDGRLKDTGTITPSGRIRCERCTSMYYFIPAPAVRLAIVVTVTARELAYCQAQQMTEAEMLAFFGLGDPFIALPVLAPVRR